MCKYAFNSLGYRSRHNFITVLKFLINLIRNKMFLHLIHISVFYELFVYSHHDVYFLLISNNYIFYICKLLIFNNYFYFKLYQMYIQLKNLQVLGLPRWSSG